MLKNKIELIRDGRPRVLLTWHKRTESDEIIPIAIEYLDDLEPELRTTIENLALQPVYAIVDGTRKRVAPGRLRTSSRCHRFWPVWDSGRVSTNLLVSGCV